MTYTGTLTPANLAAIETVRDHWMTVGLSTDRCDRPAAEAAVRRAYTTAGLPEPPLVIWMDSPLGGVLASWYLRHGLKDDQLRDQLGGQLWDQLGGQLWDQLWDQLGGQLWDQLWGQLGGQLWDQLGGQLRGQLRDQLRDQLWDQLWGQLGGQLGGQLWDQLRGQLRGQLGGQLRGQLWDQLWGQLRGQLRDQLGDQLWDQLWGQLGGQLRGQLGCCLDPWYEAYWLAVYGLALPVAGLPVSPRLDAIAEAISETGWWWPMRGAVVLTDRPTALVRDNQARLHCATGPALAYADGYAGHWWHGVRVPADLIAGWDPDRIMRESNSEIRRCAVEAAAAANGWDHIITAAGWPQIGQTVPDPGNPGQVLSLYRLDRVYDEPVHLLRMTNGTVERDGCRHEFGETVPASITDPVAAAAWQIGISPEHYRQTVRRT